jgi:hypothetical protein
MFLGLIIGAVISVVGIYGALYYLLNIAEAKVLEDRKDEVKKKEDQPKLETKPLPGADVAGFLQVLGPSAQKPTSVWSWGDLKQSTLFYQDLKGHSKGVISLTNARMTVIKTKVGRLWKATNYIRLVNPDRALLGEYRECVLFFRNGKEMEDWYLALKVATQIHQPAASALQSARRLHFTSVMRSVGYDWLISAIPSVPRPASVTPLPSEHPKLQPAASTSVLTTPTNGTHSFALEDDFQLLGSGKGGDSSKWVNLLAHRVFYFLNDDPGFVGLVKKKIAAKLAKLKKPSMLKSLTLRGITFGTKLPIVSNISIRSADTDGSLRLDADMAYHGSASVELDLVVEVEILGTKIASFPISIKVVIKTIVGKVQLAFSPPPSDLMWMGFYTEPHIELEIDSFIGEKHRLVNIPQLTNIIVSKLKQEIVEMMLMPDMDDWPLPHLKVPKGQTREKYVQWEYQAGYTPPPTIVTEFDSSDSEDDIRITSVSKTKNDEKKSTSNANSAASAASQHPHPFASTFSSSVDVPVVGMKARSPSTGSSSSSPSASTPTTSTQSTSSSKPLPLTPTQGSPATKQAAPKIPSRATQPAASGTTSYSSVVPLMPSTTTVSPPPVPSNTPASTTPSSGSSTVVSSTPSSAPASLPSSAAPTPTPTQSPATKPLNTTTSQSQPDLPIVGDFTSPTTSSSMPTLPSSTAVVPESPAPFASRTAADQAATEDRNARPVRGLHRVPTPPKLEMQALHSSLIECDSHEASEAIFGPDPGTKSEVVPSAPFEVHDSLPPIVKDLPVTNPAAPDPLLERAANSAFDHSIEVPRDGGTPILTSHHQFEPSGVSSAVLSEEEDARNGDKPVEETTKEELSEKSEKSDVTPLIEIDSGTSTSDPSTTAPKAPFELEEAGKSEASSTPPVRELTKSAEPGVLVEASFDPLFHPRDGMGSPGATPPVTLRPTTPQTFQAQGMQSTGSAPVLPNQHASTTSEPTLVINDSPTQGTSSLTPSASAPNLSTMGPFNSIAPANEAQQQSSSSNPPSSEAQQDWSRIFEAPASSSSSSSQSASRPSSGKIPSFDSDAPTRTSPAAVHEAVGRTVHVEPSDLPPLPPRARPASESYSSMGSTSQAEPRAASSGDPFADIFTGSSEHSGFHAALQPAPSLPPRPKKNNSSGRDSTSFPAELYASEPPKTWTASAHTKKDKPSTTQSVKATLRGFIDTIKKLDD